MKTGYGYALSKPNNAKPIYIRAVLIFHRSKREKMRTPRGSAQLGSALIYTDRTKRAEIKIQTRVACILKNYEYGLNGTAMIFSVQAQRLVIAKKNGSILYNTHRLSRNLYHHGYRRNCLDFVR